MTMTIHRPRRRPAAALGTMMTMTTHHRPRRRPARPRPHRLPAQVVAAPVMMMTMTTHRRPRLPAALRRPHHLPVVAVTQDLPRLLPRRLPDRRKGHPRLRLPRRLELEAAVVEMQDLPKDRQRLRPHQRREAEAAALETTMMMTTIHRPRRRLRAAATMMMTMTVRHPRRRLRTLEMTTTTMRTRHPRHRLEAVVARALPRRCPTATMAILQASRATRETRSLLHVIWGTLVAAASHANRAAPSRL
jgi:hypothetical protein